MRGHRKDLLPLASLFLLAGVYWIYWPHAEYVHDDWLHLVFFRRAEGGGLGGYLRILGELFQNKIYGGFQIFWASQWINCFLYWIFGYAPRIAFGAIVLLHTGNACLFYTLLCRLQTGPRLAFLTSASFFLIPTAHGSLFWPVNCSFYVWPLFWLLLYLHSVLGALEAGRLRARAAVKQACLALLTVFSGAPAVYLLLFSPLWMAIVFRGRAGVRTALAVSLLNFGVVGPAVLTYRGYLLSLTDPQQLAVRRFFFGYEYSKAALRNTVLDLAHLSGATERSYYHLEQSSAAAAIAVLAAGLVFLAARRLQEDGTAVSPARLAVFAAGMGMLAYAPIAFLNSKTLRHYYTFSPYLALLLVLPAGLAGRLPRRLGLAWGALLAGYFAACTVAEIQQCWTPMSQHTQAVKGPVAGLRHDLSDGDWVVAPAVPLAIGTALNFSIGLDPGAYSFAQYLTGVRGVRFVREIVVERGQLRFHHHAYLRNTSTEELSHSVHVIAPDESGRYRRRRYAAWESEPGRYQLLALKASPPPPSGLLTRDQLRPMEADLYFVKPFDHDSVER